MGRGKAEHFTPAPRVGVPEVAVGHSLLSLSVPHCILPAFPSRFPSPLTSRPPGDEDTHSPRSLLDKSQQPG